MRNTKIVMAGILIGLFAGGAVSAQQADSTAHAMKFLAVLNDYKKPPLFVEMSIGSHSDFGTDNEDLQTSEVRIYLDKKDAYLRYGNFEQLVNDSLAVIVNGELKRMVAYTSPGKIRKKLFDMIGSSVSDSSVNSLLSKYSIQKTNAFKGNAEFRLESRKKLQLGDFARESIVLTFNDRSLPVKVVHVVRELIPIDSSTFYQLEKNEELKGKLFHQESWFLAIHETTQTYEYKMISRAQDLRIPVKVSDRIRSTGEGLVPAEGYKEYTLNVFEAD